MTLSEMFLRERFRKGAAKGRQNQNELWQSWNHRRQEAEEQGCPFNDPPPEPPADYADYSPSVEVFLNDSKAGETMSTNQLDGLIDAWTRQGRRVDVYAHEGEMGGFSYGGPRLRVIVVPPPGTTNSLITGTMTDRQDGWKEGINLVLSQFWDAAWQKGFDSDRDEAVQQITNRIKMLDAHRTIQRIVEPFIKCLRGEALPKPPFGSAIPERDTIAMRVALQVIFVVFQGFRRGDGPEPNWTWGELAEDMANLVEFEGRERSQDFRQGMADVVRPFYRMLKGDPISEWHEDDLLNRDITRFRIQLRQLFVELTMIGSRVANEVPIEPVTVPADAITGMHSLDAAMLSVSQEIETLSAGIERLKTCVKPAPREFANLLFHFYSAQYKVETIFQMVEAGKKMLVADSSGPSDTWSRNEGVTTIRHGKSLQNQGKQSM